MSIGKSAQRVITQLIGDTDQLLWWHGNAEASLECVNEVLAGEKMKILSPANTFDKFDHQREARDGDGKEYNMQGGL